MNKIVKTLFCAAATVAAAACAKEMSVQPTEVSDAVLVPMSFSAQMTKTALAGNGKSVIWQEGNSISIFGGSSHTEFKAKSVSDDGNAACFEGESELAAEYNAVYPYSPDNTFSDGVFGLVIPQTQNAVPGSFDPKAAFAVASTSGSALAFFNVGALVSVTVNNDNIKAVVLSSTDGDEILAGSANVSFRDGVPVITEKKGVSSVALTGDFQKGGKYYFVVLPGSYSGLRISYIDADGKASWTSSPSRIDINRNGNFNCGTITMDNFRAVGPDVSLYMAGEGAEEGQKLAYIPEGHYNTVLPYTDKLKSCGEGDALYFEAFTRLLANKPYYFKADNGLYVNAGSATYSANAETVTAATVSEDGVYRLRINTANGKTGIAKVSRVFLRLSWTAVDTDIPYAGNGVWKKESFNVSVKGNANNDERYRFIMMISNVDGSNSQSQGWSFDRYVTGNRPDGNTDASYYDMKPTNLSQWDNLWKYPDSLYDPAGNSWYADLSFIVNGDVDFYTHRFENPWKKGEGPCRLCIGGEGAEQGAQFNYLDNSDWYNTGQPEYNDFVGRIDGYYYEIFTHLEAGRPYYFYGADNGRFYSAATYQEAGSAAEASATVDVSGEYMIRFDMKEGRGHMHRINKVWVVGAYDIMHEGNSSLDYRGNGVWAKDDLPILFGNNSDGRYKFCMKFDIPGFGPEGLMRIDGRDSRYVQWSNSEWYKGSMFGFNSAWHDSAENGRYHATFSLKMNRENTQYSQEVTNVTDSHSTFKAGEDLFIGGEGSENGQKFVYLKNSGFYEGSIEDRTGAIDGYYYELFTHLEADKDYYFYYIEDGVARYLKPSGFEAASTASAAASRVGESGEYRLRVDPSANAVTMLKVTSVYVVAAGNGEQPDRMQKGNSQLSYAGNGVWSSHLTVAHDTWDGGGRADGRYKYVMEFGSVAQGWNNGGSGLVKPGPDSKWDGTFTFPGTVTDPGRNWTRYKADFTLTFNTSGKYSQSISNIEDTQE